MQNAMKYMVPFTCVVLLLFNEIVVSVVCDGIRERRQATTDYAGDYAAPDDKKDDKGNANYNEGDAGTVDTVDDSAVDKAVKTDDTPEDKVDDALPEQTKSQDNTDSTGDDFTASAPERPPKENSSKECEEKAKKEKKAKKRSKFMKDVIKYLKKVLAPQNLMQNQWVTEMLRQFSNSADDDYKSAESVEHTEKPARRRRGRPRGRRSKKKMPTGLKGLIAYGLRTMTEIDSRKLRRNLRYVRRIARKAKKPLKTAVKILLSSQGNGGMAGAGAGYGGGGGGYGNNY